MCSLLFSHHRHGDVKPRHLRFRIPAFAVLYFEIRYSIFIILHSPKDSFQRTLCGGCSILPLTVRPLHPFRYLVFPAVFAFYQLIGFGVINELLGLRVEPQLTVTDTVGDIAKMN